MYTQSERKTLQEAISRLNDEELAALHGLVCYIDEFATDRNERCLADAQLENKKLEKNDRSYNPYEAGKHQGEAVGTQNSTHRAILEIGGVISSPINPPDPNQ